MLPRRRKPARKRAGSACPHLHVERSPNSAHLVRCKACRATLRAVEVIRTRERHGYHHVEAAEGTVLA